VRGLFFPIDERTNFVEFLLKLGNVPPMVRYRDRADIDNSQVWRFVIFNIAKKHQIIKTWRQSDVTRPNTENIQKTRFVALLALVIFNDPIPCRYELHGVVIRPSIRFDHFPLQFLFQPSFEDVNEKSPLGFVELLF